MGNKTRLVAFLSFIGLLLIYLTTSAGKTPFNHFTLLSDAFLKGKFHVSGNYPWLEKVPFPDGSNNFYVVNPPMPAILLAPLVLIFGKSFPQQYLAHLMGAGLGVIIFYLSLKVKKDKKLALWSTLLISLGSIVWFLSSVGSTWYLGQISCAFFLSWALLEVLGKSRSVILGLLLGAAYLSRTHTALTFPFIIFINWKKFKKYNYLMPLVLTFLLFLIFDIYYNYSRFGTIYNKGYLLIPGVATEAWYSKGLLHPSYLLNHLKIIFAKLPIFSNKYPYVMPSWSGLALWITTPAFIFAFLSPLKKKITRLLWICLGLVFAIVATHGSTGFAQFGYRFAVDFYPFLTLLTILGVKRQKGPKKIHWLLLIIGVIVNLWGVIWINKLNLVGW